MDLFSVAAGIALGAAFSPFWIMIWGMIKSKLTTLAAPKQ